MQALKKPSLTEDGLQYVTDAPEPRVGHRDVKIRVEAASICGTDQSIYQITSRQGMRDEMLAYNGGDVTRYQPIIIGHEFCGEVVELGEDVNPEMVGVGDYVTSEYTRVRGHGMGMFADSKPHILEDVTTRIDTGMTLIVHPNTYHPVVGYMVLGDAVVVTENGCEVLTATARDLFSVPV